jgi:hypothetical protein
MFRVVLVCAAIFLSHAPDSSPQEGTVEVHIKLVNGLDGAPMKFTEVGLEASPDFREISSRTDGYGVATIRISASSVIYSHNTKRYVACADEAGGLLHNDFKVSKILDAGIVQAVAKPNKCDHIEAAPSPGMLLIFVRPWEPGEDNPL